MSPFATMKELQHNRLMIGRDLEKFEKDLTKNYQERLKCNSMLREAEFALKELDLKEDATVYKLVGPILVKQDPAEPKANLHMRIAHLTDEVKRLDAIIEDLEDQLKRKREKMSMIEEKLQSLGVGEM